MKRCPECRRDYYDETLLYCLDDGTALLEGPSSGDRAQTVSLKNNSEAATAILSDPSAPAPMKRRKWLGVGATAIVLLAAGVALVVFKPWDRPASSNASQPIKIERLTTNGRATTAAISPDGKFYVYTRDEGGKHSLWVRQLAASRDVEIIPAAEDVYYWGIGFSPDSNYINFVEVQYEKNVDWVLYQMPVLGGTQKRLMGDADSGVGYSPDGKQFAYIRDEHPTPEESSLVIANNDGTEERVLASRKAPEYFAARGRIPAWSPDGKTIACITGDDTPVMGKMDVVEVNVADGAIKPVQTQAWNYITQVAWLKDKSRLLVLGQQTGSKSYDNQIWSFSYPAGEARRITADLDDYLSISLTAESDALVTVQASSISNLWVAPMADTSRAVQIKSGGANGEGNDGLAWTPDGRIVYASRIGGADDVWIINSDGSGPKQLTSDTGLNLPSRVTPDGRYIVFASLRNEEMNIWRMDLDGSNQKQLTNGNIGTFHPSVTPDSKWVIFTAENTDGPRLWKVSIDGGDPVQLMNRFTNSPEVSPDGKWIACSYRHDSNSTWRYAIIPIDGGEPIKVFDLLGKQSDFRWSADGKSLYYLRDTEGGVTNIWSMPLDDKPPSQVTDFKTERIYNFALSSDRKQVALSRGTTTSDVVLIRDFR
jgi:eukaryotic-like serine/threonine-protein kinase